MTTDKADKLRQTPMNVGAPIVEPRYSAHAEPTDQKTSPVAPSSLTPFVEEPGTGTTRGRGNENPPFGRIAPRTAAGNDANPLLTEPMPPETSTVHQQKKPISEPRQ